MQALKLVTGVVEVGLFVGMADEVFFAMEVRSFLPSSFSDADTNSQDMTIVHKRKLQ